MGRTDAPTRRRGAGNRDALIRAGFEAIASLGYARATTAEICRRAGVSSGTFFHYFATKEELLLAILGESDPPAEHSTLAEVLTGVLAEAADPLGPGFVREVSTLASLPRVSRALAEQAAKRRAMLTRVLEIEREAGRVRDDLPVGELRLRVEVLVAGIEALAADTDPPEPQELESALRALLDGAVHT